MEHLEDWAGRGRQTQRLRRALYAAHGLAALGLAGAALGPAPLATIAAGGTLSLIALQHLLSRRLGEDSVELIRTREALLLEAEAARHRTEELFEMTDMLQSAADHADAGAVLEATSRRLLPEFSGALYVFNNSRDRLDVAVAWSPDGGFAPAETLAPGNCWALKRGKPHVNDAVAGTLCCAHHTSDCATLELPMVARGTVHGLLMLAAPDGAASLKGVHRVGRALADSMSLALSNIALREKLRTQSLRDPLTGLYNRRYMEDALDRYLGLAARSKEPIAAIMIDLDGFKALNDAHGHAKGDAVLRDVAVQLVGALRPTDVVSRYGGEELLVILPSCPLADALAKAEILRARIESLSESHGVPVSASLGVAAVPETSAGRDDLIPMADAALYAAKKAGRNRVHGAPPRAAQVDGAAPRLAA